MASKTRIFFTNAISLTLTALLIRGISVVFNIYVSNVAGSEAMGLFSLIGSVYSFAVTIAASSINLGTARLVSDALGTFDRSLAKKTASKALRCCSVTGGTATVLLLAFSEKISEYVLGDMRACRSLQILALTLLPIAVCSCLSGYFTAVRRVKVTSAVQIIVQFSKIAVTAIFLSFFADLGAEEACISLVLGITASELLSFIITFILYLYDKHKYLSDTSSDDNINISVPITRRLLSITAPVTFSAGIRSALTAIQHVLIPRGIAASGKSWTNALSSYGALHGMALPLLLFPQAFVSSFSGLLIPEISECHVQRNFSRLKRVSFRSMTMSLIFSIGVAGIMVFFSQQLGIIIYNSEETALYIRVLAPLIPVMYVDSAADAILKGSGYQVYSMNVNIIDTLTSCIFAVTLIPKIGIWGYVISIYATEILNTSLSMAKMISVSGIKPKIIHQIAMPILCIIGATNISQLIFGIINIHLPQIVALTLNITVSILIYILLLHLTHTVGNDELEFINASLMSEKRYNMKFGKASKIEKPSPQLVCGDGKQNRNI